MADSTINELVNLTSVANNDELVLWDTSASETKKATVSNVVTPVATDVATSAINALDVASVGGSGKYISAISETNGKISATASNIDTTVTSGSSNPVTSGAMYKQKFWNDNRTALSASGWYKIAIFGKRNQGSVIQLKLASDHYNSVSSSHDIKLNYSYKAANCLDFSLDTASIFSKIKLCYNENNNDIMALYVYYNKNVNNNCAYTIDITSSSLDVNVTLFNFVTDSTVYDSEIEYNLGTDGVYFNGAQLSSSPLEDTQILNQFNTHLNMYAPDLNDLTVAGIYSVNIADTSVSHAPSVGACTIIVTRFNNSADNLVQLLTALSSGNMYKRIKNSGTWGGWTAIG